MNYHSPCYAAGAFLCSQEHFQTKPQQVIAKAIVGLLGWKL